nr:Nucleotidyl transferase of unknown function (DUF2204) [uncultured bacterium]
MLTSVDIERLLAKTNDRLAEKNEHGTILLAGGAVMTAVFQSRNATLDIDAVFAPTHVIRDIAKAISEEEGLEADWINDGVKGFIDTTKMGSLPYREFSHLSVNRLDDESLLALKLSSARDNAGKDMDDSIELMSALGISSMDELYAILEDKIPTARAHPEGRLLLAGGVRALSEDAEGFQGKRLQRFLRCLVSTPRQTYRRGLAKSERGKRSPSICR